jgi:putative tryptophan/tyrosine transport system substrate-binding protein
MYTVRRSISSLMLGLFAVEAQPPAKVPRIGMLMPVSPEDAAGNIEAFQQRLAELGHHDGKNINMVRRFTGGRTGRVAALAAELVALQPDVIVTWGTPAAMAAKSATMTIPIVMAAATDPVESGLIESLARPGRNITGVTSGGAELHGKQLELLKELVPGAIRTAVLWNPDNAGNRVVLEHTKAEAQVLGLRLQLLDVRDASELEGAFVAMTRERADVLHVIHELVFHANRKAIVDLATKYRLPATYGRREYVDSGGLISYGLNFRDNFRRAAYYVDRILRGAEPGDLPVEQPTKFELVINVKTAKALGLTIPQSILVRADQVIE